MNNKSILYNNDLPSLSMIIGSVGIDTETMGLNVHRDRLCLAQLCDEAGNIFMVKFDGIDYSAPNLRALLMDENRLKVFHYGRFDIAALRFYLNIPRIPNVYCTKIASKLCRTYTDSHGLKTLVRELVGTELDKEMQSSNWGATTLSDRQLRYAANDVIYLHRMKVKLDEMLVRVGREDLARQCFSFLNDLCTLDISGFSEQIFNH